MRGYQTHLEATAYHEAGHAVVALKVGRYVPVVEVNSQNPEQGAAYIIPPRGNPFNIGDGEGNARAAWDHTYETTLGYIFIALAGPLAESKLLRKPLRLMGSRSDLNRAMMFAKRLKTLSEFACEYTDVQPVNIHLLDQMRDRVQRWIRRPRNWEAISMVAAHLVEYGDIDGGQLAYLIGVTKDFESGQGHLALRGIGKPARAKRTADIVDLRSARTSLEPHRPRDSLRLSRAHQ